MKIIKRNGNVVKFEKDKITNAIMKAMNSCGVVDEENANVIAESIQLHYELMADRTATVDEVEKLVHHILSDIGLNEVARCYEGYRAVQEYKRKVNTIDHPIAKLLNETNDELRTENSNKNIAILATGRDYIAGECSKDYAKRVILPAEIVNAHDNGVLHYHDLDFATQPFMNCCLIPIKELLEGGTVLNSRLYTKPETFEKACGIVAQIIATVTANQFGGNSVNVKHLGEYLHSSHKRIIEEETTAIKDYEGKINQEVFDKRTKEKLKKVCRSGIRSLLYQINGFSTHSGQSPFTTLFLEIEEGHEYEEYIAMVVEEIIEQRYIGMRNEQGVFISPAFPKLVFVLDENNMHPNSKYYDIKKKAIRCTAKRLVPDYVSAKKMREQYEGNVFSMMGCRSFLSPWKDENGNYKFEGRGNMGVVSLNLPQIALLAEGDEEKFWNILEERLQLCKRALMFRYSRLKGVKSDVSPLHFQHGVIGRLQKGEPIDSLLENGYMTISLGYIGVYEMTKLMKGVSHSAPEGKEFALKVIKRMKECVDQWKVETGLGFGLYGTPSEGLCDRFCRIDREKFGAIKDITDKGWYTNSYHYDVREEVDAFAKLEFESEFQSISTGGCISYIEVANMSKNLDALEQVIDFGYDTTVYFEINTKSDYCYDCSFDGEMKLKDETVWYCPNCGNDNFDKLHIVRRTCGYIGEQAWNEGKTKEIGQRVLHI